MTRSTSRSEPIPEHTMAQCADEGPGSPRSPHLSEAELRALSRRQLRNHIFDLECDPALGYGHLGGMYDRSKENLVAIALLYQQIARELEAARATGPASPHRSVKCSGKPS